MKKSEYIIYVDESGDHGLDKIDVDYPVFVLSFCCFSVRNYIDQAVPALQELKFSFFGHDQIILHEHHIRKQKDNFAFLRTDSGLRNMFLEKISTIIQNINVEVFAVIIDKKKLKNKYLHPDNPYNLGLRFGLERIYNFLLEKGQENNEVFFVFERRGDKEDNSLELEFRRICDKNTEFGYKNVDFSKMKFNIIFADKKSNSSGLQIADLTARPLGINYLRPDQENKAVEIIKEKIKSLKNFP